MKDRCDGTLEKHCLLRNFGNLIVMKECEFQQPSQTKKYVSKITCKDLLVEIRSGPYFGVAICNVHVPQHLKETNFKMPPIFKNIEITNQDVGLYMADLCRKLEEFKNPFIH